ncbi:hypothetical protein DYB32_005342 [Aphanomyces invadans]|uniref:Ribosome recycling factor domain-containing protein n=1 Tax=Aphanomyces invadans TaxID=157072 RepID=A0A3R6Y844_9STRA|nr:hypothetical protein DYB32_005342 [Aphanomyces invadans]
MSAFVGSKAAEPVTEALGDVAKKTHEEVKKNMRGAVANYIKVLAAMRPGQADAGIFDSLMVSAYGQMASLSQLAQVSVVGPTELAVSVYDPSVGLPHMINRHRFHETRDELVKAAKKQAEAARQHVRRVRQDGMNEIKKLKDSISEDDIKVEQDKIQKLTDDHISEISRLLASKEKDLTVI